MTGIFHKQAINLIHRRLDGSLTASQTLSLDEHLLSCDTCRAYSTEMDLLPTRLQNEFHLRWDKNPGPSQKIVEQVTAKARSIPMTNRISSGVKLFAGITTLIVLAFLVNFVVSQLQGASTAAIGTEPAGSSPLAENRLIAFTSEQNGNFDIYTMHADGSGLTNITNNPAYDLNPIWSPNGKYIAFESDRNGSMQIYLMDADGSNVVQLTNDEADHSLNLNFDGKYNPWSPDGNKLLFLQNLPGEGTQNLYVTRINAENKVLLASGNNITLNSSWSPNGEHIGYVLNDSPTPSEAFVPDIYVVDSDGSNPRELKTLIPQNEILDGLYYWLADRQSIVFITNKKDPLRQTVYEFDLETNTLLQKGTLEPRVIDWRDEITLIWDTEKAGSLFIWQRSDGTSNTLGWDDPSCLLDITRSLHGNFAIAGYCPDSKNFKFYWANSDGSTIKQLLDSPKSAMIGELGDITWSPDDQFIAFTIASDKTSIYLLNLEDALNDSSIQPKQVVIGGGQLYTIPSWQPVLDSEIFEEKPTPEPEVQADNSRNLIIDPQSCKPFSDTSFDLRPPNQLYGYELIQGISFVDGDFSYEFWLYCDPSLKPDDNEHFSNVAGLGVYASWRYNGPEVEGMSHDYFGFEPVIKLKSFTKWIGPLYKASADGKFGMPAKETLREHIQQGTPIQFSILVDSSLGQNGATFSFNLEPTESGLKIRELRAQHSTTFYDGLIAFTSDTDNANLDIYTMRPDGTELTNLTDNPANDFNPFWSPDGRRIAFESDRDGSVQIFLMDADGSNVTQLTGGEADHIFRSANPWSPDGSKLTFTESAPGEEKWVLFVMDADGQNKIQLGQTPDIYGAPSWSPDGEHIAFVLVEPQENRDMAHIYVVGTDGSNLANVTKLLPEDEDLTSWNFPWAADGGSIFFVAGRFAWVTNSGRFAVYEASLDGNILTEIVTYPERIDDWWDGTALVQGFEGPLTLAWVRSDGTTSTLKPFENCQTREMMSSTYKRLVNGSLLYGAQCDDGDLWLYSINSDGTLIKQLLDFPITAREGSLVDISWSPDGIFIAFTVAFSDKTDMYILNVNEAVKNPSIQPDKYVVGGAGFISYNISWQPTIRTTR